LYIPNRRTGNTEIICRSPWRWFHQGVGRTSRVARREALRLHDLLELGQDLGAVLRQVSDDPGVVQQLLEIAGDDDQVQDVPAMAIFDGASG